MVKLFLDCTTASSIIIYVNASMGLWVSTSYNSAIVWFSKPGCPDFHFTQLFKSIIVHFLYVHLLLESTTKVQRQWDISMHPPKAFFQPKVASSNLYSSSSKERATDTGINLHRLEEGFKPEPKGKGRYKC